MKKLTTQEALEILGQGIAHESLRLSQKEHLILIEAFKTIQSELEPKKDEKDKGNS